MGELQRTRTQQLSWWNQSVSFHEDFIISVDPMKGGKFSVEVRDDSHGESEVVGHVDFNDDKLRNEFDFSHNAIESKLDYQRKLPEGTVADEQVAQMRQQRQRKKPDDLEEMNFMRDVGFNVHKLTRGGITRGAIWLAFSDMDDDPTFLKPPCL